MVQGEHRNELGKARDLSVPFFLCCGQSYREAVGTHLGKASPFMLTTALACQIPGGEEEGVSNSGCALARGHQLHPHPAPVPGEVSGQCPSECCRNGPTRLVLAPGVCLLAWPAAQPGPEKGLPPTGLPGRLPQVPAPSPRPNSLPSPHLQEQQRPQVSMSSLSLAELVGVGGTQRWGTTENIPQLPELPLRGISHTDGGSPVPTLTQLGPPRAGPINSLRDVRVLPPSQAAAQKQPRRDV